MATRHQEVCTLERLVVVVCPWLEGDDPQGSHLRDYAQLLTRLVSVCPFLDPIAPGLLTLPIRAPLRYFGSEDAVLKALYEVIIALFPEKGESVRFGIGEGLFAAWLAATTTRSITPGKTTTFLGAQNIDVLCPKEVAALFHRLGIHTLFDLGALESGDVSDRFGNEGLHYQRLAQGREGEPLGWRVKGLKERCATALGKDLGLLSYQGGFWGGVSAKDERAGEAFSALQREEGIDAVVVALLQGGRGPADQFVLSPWRPPKAVIKKTAPRASAPWPGSVPPPPPSRVTRRGVRHVVRLRDESGATVGVSGRGLLSGDPHTFAIRTKPTLFVRAWSPAWPVEERWWSTRPRRVARIQIVTEDGVGWLLALERGVFFVEAIYD